MCSIASILRTKIDVQLVRIKGFNRVEELIIVLFQLSIRLQKLLSKMKMGKGL